MVRAMWLRSLSTAPPRRVLCSLAELKARAGSALKFPLSMRPEAPASDARSGASRETPRKAATRGGRSGFVFFCEDAQAPRAFVNSCPHALLELDLDDSDFFSDGFVQCKAHGAFFDPVTGICLQGPAAARRGRLDKQLGALTELAVRVEGPDVVLVAPSSEGETRTSSHRTEQEWHDYRASRQRQLAVALATRHDDVVRMQQDLHAKTMARLRQYAAKEPPTTKVQSRGTHDESD